MDQSSGLNIASGILKKYTGDGSDIIIPDNVKGIASAVFKDCHGLRSVMMPAGLETIESRCFEGCDGLKTVMFNSGLNSIGKYAFAGCSSLAFHRLPAGLAVIGAYAFKDCTSLTSLEIPSSVTEIGVGAFEGCTRLNSIRFTGKQTAIGTAFGTHPFTGCSELKIYAPAGSAVEKFANDNGIPVINISVQETESTSTAYSNALDAAYANKPKTPKRTAPAEKVKFGFGTPETMGSNTAGRTIADKAAEKAAADKAAAERAAAERAAAKNAAAEKAAAEKAAAEKAAADKAAAERAAAKKAAAEKAAAERAAAEKAATEKAAAERAAAERLAAQQKEQEDRANQKIYDEAVSLYESGTESDMQKAAELMRSIGSFSDARTKAREFSKGLKKKQKEVRKAEAAKARQDRLQAAELKKAAAREYSAEPEKAGVQAPSAGTAKPDISLPKLNLSKKAAAVILAIVIAVGAGAGAAFYVSRHSGSGGGGGGGYTLTLEDYINSNDAAKQQLVQSVEDTDVIISVSGNTLIYTYDLSASNSMTPEIAQSDELKQSLGETLDSSDEQFTELCAGLEKDTGISGVSVEVVFKYGDDELLKRTYTSAGKQQ